MNRTKRLTRGNPQMRLVIMLAVVGASGSILFAAESPATRPPATVVSEAGAQAAAAPPAAARSTEKSTQEGAEPALGRNEPGRNEPPAPAARAPEPAGEPKSGPNDGPNDGPRAESNAPPARGATQRNAGSPQRFTPSEEVRADFDVSFPIDI